MFVTPRTARFLVVGLEAFGHVFMYHKAHIGLINTHSKGISSYNYAGSVIFPAFLSFGPFIRTQACMVIIGFYVVACIKPGYLGTFLTAAYIYNAAPFYTMCNIQHLAKLALGMLYHITYIFSFKAFLKYLLVF